jgi:hypothetical protein
LEQENHRLEKNVVDLQAEIQLVNAAAAAEPKQVQSPPKVETNSSTSISALSNQVIQITERCQVLQDENSVLFSRLEEMRARNIELTNEKVMYYELIGRFLMFST